MENSPGRKRYIEKHFLRGKKNIPNGPFRAIKKRCYMTVQDWYPRDINSMVPSFFNFARDQVFRLRRFFSNFALEKTTAKFSPAFGGIFICILRLEKKH